MNKMQKYCLWAGTLIMDLVGAMILYDRVHKWGFSYRGRGGRYKYLEWTAGDIFILLFLIALTTGVILYSLKDYKPKVEQKQ